jgi:hypothetical protein
MTVTAFPPLEMAAATLRFLANLKKFLPVANYVS